MHLRSRRRLLVACLAAAALLAACRTGPEPFPTRSPAPESPGPSKRPGSPTPSAATATPSTPPAPPDGLEKLDHLVFIIQENRSFDHYFGTYPGADGIPMRPDGTPAVCIPHPTQEECMRPYHTTNDRNIGGPHGRKASVIDVNRGKMDGFIRGALSSPHSHHCVLRPKDKGCRALTGPKGQPDVLSYRTRADIPNYWAYADWGVLQDRFFASVDSYTLPAHMYIFSGWAATCRSGPMTCVSDPTPEGTRFPWTAVSYLLDEANVSWGWFVGNATNICPKWPRCRSKNPEESTPFNWNPVPGFTVVRKNKQIDNVRPVSEFLDGLEAGDIPSVSWIIPGQRVSEHPGKGSMRPGYQYVTELVNAIAGSPVWDSTAIFITWDDWGGFYDHVPPPRVDRMGYGIRVPGLVLSPYAKEGYIQSDTLSFDAYLKLIEDRFLGGARLNPKTMSRPDSRKNVREDEEILGDLRDAFDFTQQPRPPDGIILDPGNGP